MSFYRHLDNDWQSFSIVGKTHFLKVPRSTQLGFPVGLWLRTVIYLFLLKIQTVAVCNCLNPCVILFLNWTVLLLLSETLSV